MYKIYKISCEITRKEYIGVTRLSEDKRWTQHVYDSQQSGYLTVFHRAIKKYGVAAFAIQIIAEHPLLTKADAFVLEKAMIVSYKTKWPSGYNTTDGGEGSPGAVWSASSRRKASKHFTTIWQDEETRQRIIKSMQGNRNALGMQHTAETKTHLSRINKGRKLNLSPEERAKRAARIGRLNKVHPPRKGKKNSTEHNLKVSVARTGKPLSASHRNSLSKAISRRARDVRGRLV